MADNKHGRLFTEAEVKGLLVTAINVERMGSPNVVEPLTAASLVLAAAKVPD